MKWMLTAVVFALLQSHGCNKQNAKLPPCIQDKIDLVMQKPRYNPPATVYQYYYIDRYVYVFSSDCCDQYNYAYDKDCHPVCAPSGGITGKGDGRCPNFETQATGKTLVWKDGR
jgi:hypothetical protein